ncbi:hypothetical protein [Bradyrhizobium sp. SEMIA]|uniref:hypothetical protein n=1 Tax=Bradyrhizobium sp. SEMIA TaxID=2597515 RepID=UPI002ACD6812|nr:hypothetical protein [Bradyrhizobium sp. SEMIA]
MREVLYGGRHPCARDSCRLYDTDAKQSAKSRVRVLNILAEGRTRLLAYHFAWPGIGHAAKQGDGFRYYPEEMTLIPLSPT